MFRVSRGAWKPAFIDRGALWNQIREKFALPVAPVRRRRPQDENARNKDGSRFSFEYNGVEYEEPGLPRDSDRFQRKRVGPKLQSKIGLRTVSYHNVAANGPDGEGPDERIKNVSDFNSCITEVVAMFAPTLSDIAWDCTVTHMPDGVFEALKRAPHLKSLDLNLSVRRHFSMREYKSMVDAHESAITTRTN